MERLVIVLFGFACAQVEIEWRTEADKLNLPDLEFIHCVPERAKDEDIRLFNKVEVVNRLREYTINGLVSIRGYMPENNTDLNDFITCVWRESDYLDRHDAIKYEKLIEVVRDALVKAIGKTPTSFNLCTVAANEIINKARGFGGTSTGNKIAKIQNHIVKNLRYYNNNLHM